MKNCLTLLVIVIICSCSTSPKKGIVQSTASNQQTEDSLKVEKMQGQNSPGITFKNIEGQGVLIGDKIEFLDPTLKPVEDISDFSGKIIEIKGVSDSLFNQADEFCNAYWYVRIKVADREGIVNGRQVFKILDSSQDTSLLIDGGKFEINPTEFFGIGVAYQGDLMDCPTDQPVIIRDERNGFYGLVAVIQNDLHKKATWNRDFPFFELRADAGSHDKIDSVIPSGSNIRLKIHRHFQEGENDYEVLLRYDQDKYIAEYLSYGETKF